MKIALCILTLNERPSLVQMLPNLLQQEIVAAFDEIIAIDGGSTDGTQELFRQYSVPIIAQSSKGRGEAFLKAFTQVESDAYVFFSPDGNEDVADLPRFRPLLEAGADIVIASRMMDGAYNEEDDKVFRWRKWANKAFTLLANILFRSEGPYVTDTINGYRAIIRSVARSLTLDASDYTIEYQMTIRGFKQRARIVEFPTVEGSRIAGESGAPSIPTGIRFVRRLFLELKS